MSKKDIHEWDETYLLNLPSGEFDWIEFKESKKLDFSLSGINRDVVLRELSKQISAFANSGGGVIVFGIENPKSGQPLKVDTEGGVSLNLQKGTREWLEDVIPNLVDFPISKVNVYELTAKENEASQIKPDKAIIIVDIPSSEQAPHQASDNLYYARVGGKSRPINHRFVMDIIGRAKHPKLIMDVSLFRAGESKTYRYGGSKKLEIECYCKNNGSIYANYVNGWIYIPLSIINRNRNKKVIDEKEYSSFYFENIHKDIVGAQKTYREINLGGQKMPMSGEEPLYVTRFDPVLPRLRFQAVSEELKFKEIEDLEDLLEEKISWSIYADNAPEVKGEITIKELIEKNKK
jgi:Putative DNA-binding domain